MGKDRLNLLLVFADQMRGQDFGAAGNRRLITPSLDRLAAEGTLLTSAIANCPVCTPSRGCLLTGLNPLTHGAVANDVPIRTDVPSIATLLRAAGYRTGYIGKWHLDGVPRDRFTPPGPRRLGFDDYWAAWNCSHQYFDGKYYLNADEVRHLDGYEPDAQTRLAARFIEGHRDEPFALVLSWGPPHAPYEQVPQEFLDRYDPSAIELRPNVSPGSRREADGCRLMLAQYYAAITALDANLGALMQTLEELDLAEDTLLVFTSDHGDMLGSQGTEKKEKPWEESILVPLVMRAPRLLPAGRRMDVLTSLMDLPPTLLELLGVGAPEGMDGRSVAPFLLGQRDDVPRSVPIGIPIIVDQGWTQGMREWRGVRTARHTYARTHDGGWLLYDNLADPYQQHNLVDAPSCAAVRDELEQETRLWLDRFQDPFLHGPDMVRAQGIVEQWNARERYMHADGARVLD